MGDQLPERIRVQFIGEAVHASKLFNAPGYEYIRADLFTAISEKLEAANSALGYHPDSDTDFEKEISRLRQENRDLFHQLTKIGQRET